MYVGRGPGREKGSLVSADLFDGPGVHRRGESIPAGLTAAEAAEVIWLRLVPQIMGMLKAAAERGLVAGFHCRVRHVRSAVAVALEAKVLSRGSPPAGLAFRVVRQPHGEAGFETLFLSLVDA